nr:MAG TPA: hypothetical protein [Caudoviricetes sp.]
MTERLTKREKNGLAYFPMCFTPPCNGEGCKDENCIFISDVCEQLAKYEELEEQGLLLRLPCKVGDTVYIIIAKSISKQRVKEIIIDGYGIKFKTKRRVFGLCDVFYTVFLTKEEAEAKLKEMEESYEGK